MALTFVRTGEMISAEWVEIDHEKSEWRIPAERMKMKAVHIVPLSQQTLRLLDELKQYTSCSRYLFAKSKSAFKSTSAIIPCFMHYIAWATMDE